VEGSERARRHARVRERPATRYAAASADSGLTGVLLDSDVIIDILRGRRDIANRLRALERTGTPTYCSAVAWAEIWCGLRAGEEAAAEAFFQARREVVLDAIAGRRAGAYLARFARSHGVEIADALVAAAASTAALRLWTLNRRHYPMDDVRFYEAS
jgi:predicted nucleic acid-binding protein